MDNKIYLCPVKNPHHWSFGYKQKQECILDFEHSIHGGNKNGVTCNPDREQLSPTFTSKDYHFCKSSVTKYAAYGVAVENCTQDDYGRLWIGNGEYESMVQFCPFCGFKGE